MATSDRSGLHTIFSFFLGLMVTAFVGVGVYTFYPPDKTVDRQREQLNRQEQAIRNSKAANDLTPADREQIQKLTDRRNQLADTSQEGLERWGRSTSIILIAFATLVMAVSLIRADQLPVISNGLLLGGLFSMIYGVGWIIATDTSVTRFAVMTVALVITLGLGYVRFVRRRVGGAAPAVSGELPADLERRLRELEERLDGAASALGRKG
jgi:hypothetical protein